MARSQYIYLVRWRDGRCLLGCFTVKREAQEWAERRYSLLSDLCLSRMRDGLGSKDEYPMEWNA